jgi:hypothetical protein
VVCVCVCVCVPQLTNWVAVSILHPASVQNALGRTHTSFLKEESRAYGQTCLNPCTMASWPNRSHGLRGRRTWSYCYNPRKDPERKDDRHPVFQVLMAQMETCPALDYRLGARWLEGARGLGFRGGQMIWVDGTCPIAFLEAMFWGSLFFLFIWAQLYWSPHKKGKAWPENTRYSCSGHYPLCIIKFTCHQVGGRWQPG